jgi:hypothetical protein
MNELQATEFDDGELDGETWRFVQDARDDIRRLGKQTVESIVEIGRLLTEVKQRLPHGQWLPWLRAEFSWSETTARRFMDSHALFKSAELEDLPSLLELPPSGVSELAASTTPKAARKEVLERVAAGDRPTTTQVKETVHRHKVDRARASVGQVHAEPITITAAPTIKIEPIEDVAFAPREPVKLSNRIPDRRQWEDLFRQRVHALAHLQLTAERDDHNYARELVAREPDLRGEVLRVSVLLHTALGEMYADKQQAQQSNGEAIDIKAGWQRMPEEQRREFLHWARAQDIADDDFPDRLRAYREASGLSQTEMAEQLGCTQATVSRVLNRQLKATPAMRALGEAMMSDQPSTESSRSPS